MSAKVSIIVPVYNAEKYLRECLDSIANQSLSDIQVLLIDDGSTDRSASICKEYAEKDSRFEYYHKENGGTGSARNLGLTKTCGEYIGFVDSDDYIEKNAFEIMYKHASQNHCDILYCVMHGLHDYVSIESKIYCSEEIINCIFPVLLPHIVDSGTFRALDYSVCSRLFSRKLIQDYSIKVFDESRYIEDLVFDFECTLYAKKYEVIDKGTLYHYRKVKNSKSRSYAPNMWMELSCLLHYLFDLTTSYNRYDFSNAMSYAVFYYCCLAIKNELKNSHKGIAKSRIETIVSDSLCRNAITHISPNQMNTEYRNMFDLIRDKKADKLYYYCKKLSFKKKYIAPLLTRLMNIGIINKIYRLGK